MGKWERWYDSLPEHTKEYLKDQPIWKHNEMLWNMFGAFCVGVIIGLLF